jgi:hypothetical protein
MNERSFVSSVQTTISPCSFFLRGDTKYHRDVKNSQPTMPLPRSYSAGTKMAGNKLRVFRPKGLLPENDWKDNRLSFRAAIVGELKLPRNHYTDSGDELPALGRKTSGTNDVRRQSFLDFGSFVTNSGNSSILMCDPQYGHILLNACSELYGDSQRRSTPAAKIFP